MQILIFISHLFIYHISFFLGNKYYSILIFLRNIEIARVLILEEFYYQRYPKYKEKILLKLKLAQQEITTLNKAIRILKSKFKQNKIRKDNNFFQKIAHFSIVIIKNLSKEEVKTLFLHKYKTIMNYVYKMKNHGLFSLLAKPVLKKVPHNKKSVDMIRLLWDLYDRNPADGKLKLSLKMALLGRFISPNTVKKYLSLPRPSVPKKRKKNKKYDDSSANGNNINAKYPNHTWNVDFTCVRLFFTYVYVFFVIDIYSRKIIYFDISRYNPDIEWTIRRMKNACAEIWGKPKHLIADNGEQFKHAFETFCEKYKIKLRHGKVHSWRSNIYIERFHQTIKYEALNNLVMVRMNYLRKMIKSFLNYYNNFRPHQSLDGMTPSMVYEGKKKLELPDTEGKVIKKESFCNGLITAFSLEEAA